jgi:hypothetical protein
MSHPSGKVSWTPWVELADFDVCYGVMPKIGSSAFYEALRRHYKLPRGVTKGVHIVNACERTRYVAQPSTTKARFVVRHPLDRFESLWRSKCRDNHGTVGGHPIRGMSPEELFEYVQRNQDPHWCHQHPYASTLDKEPTLVPLDKLNEQFRLDTGIGLWYMNETEVRPSDPIISPELAAQVMDYYEKDIFVYERAVRKWEIDHETTD